MTRRRARLRVHSVTLPRASAGSENVVQLKPIDDSLQKGVRVKEYQSDDQAIDGGRFDHGEADGEHAAQPLERQVGGDGRVVLVGEAPALGAGVQLGDPFGPQEAVDCGIANAVLPAAEIVKRIAP